jgi:hypothetical protein
MEEFELYLDEYMVRNNKEALLQNKKLK